MSQSVPDQSTNYVDLVRNNADFRFLWLGQIVSLLGDWFNLVASATLLAALTGSGVAVGGLFVVRMLAPFVVTPVAGVAADRINRKHLLIGTDLLRAVVVFGFLFVRDPGDVWLLYALTALQLGISGFFFPARNAILLFEGFVTFKKGGTSHAADAIGLLEEFYARRVRDVVAPPETSALSVLGLLGLGSPTELPAILGSSLPTRA